MNGNIRRRGKRAEKRGLGFNIICPNPFSNKTVVEYHHLNKTDVIAIPKDLHKLYPGQYHKENLIPILNQIYGGVK